MWREIGRMFMKKWEKSLYFKINIYWKMQIVVHMYEAFERTLLCL